MTFILFMALVILKDISVFFQQKLVEPMNAKNKKLMHDKFFAFIGVCCIHIVFIF
jgi:hypothetical protein